MAKTAIQKVRAALGPNPSVEAKPVIRQLITGELKDYVFLRYDWIKDWNQLVDLDWWDGEGGIEVSLELGS